MSNDFNSWVHGDTEATQNSRTYSITVAGTTVVTGLKDHERIPTMLALRAAGHRTARCWIEVPGSHTECDRVEEA